MRDVALREEICPSGGGIRAKSPPEAQFSSRAVLLPREESSAAVLLPRCRTPPEEVGAS